MNIFQDICSMKIGIAAATSFEIKPTIDFLLQRNSVELEHECEILITGIGSTATTYQLTNFIHTKRPALMFQAGISGACWDELPLGETFLIKDDVFADMGVEENNCFKDVFDMGFMEPGAVPYTGGRLVNPSATEWEHSGLRAVHGVTVNEITTRADSISRIREKYHGDLESMEGAAFHYVCLQQGIRFLQLRSASNYLGERNKAQWKIKEAITNLNDALIKIIQQLPS
jgi:futalosine hydrolase